jgi:hypothetical protein
MPGELVSVLLACPECSVIGQSHSERDQLQELDCPECGHTWTPPPALDAESLIAHLRALLEAHADGSRRAFYDAPRLLRDIAAAIDAYPELVR